jgi:hypothetical protein
MSKMLAGLVGAVTVAAAAGPGHATAAEAAMQVNSYADLLKPIPNAVEVLRTLDAQPAPEPMVQDVQYYHHHHHHHHHAYYSRRYWHHHHHHHHYQRYGYGYNRY